MTQKGGTDKQTNKIQKDKTCVHCGKSSHIIDHCLDFTKAQRAMIHAATSNNDDESDADDDDDDKCANGVNICSFCPAN